MTRFPAVLLVTLMLAVLAVAPGSAAAATWASERTACGGWGYSERGSGQMDAAGRMYLPCSVADNGQHYNHIQVFNAAGQRIQQVPLRFPMNPNGTDRASDVAPSPDGSFLYVIHYATYTTYRFNRQPDGSYVADANWRLAPYPHRFGGLARPLGQFLATDGNGDIYFSSGLWACNVECTDDAIVKYGPAGNVITRFGEKVGGSWALGHSHGSFGGVTVTADGRRVFVADINNSRIQRFDRAANGTYGAVLAMGMDQHSDPNRWGACYGDGRLAGAYDVTMSAGGELLVINTTCFATNDFHAYMPHGTIEVQRFAQSGAARGSIISRSNYDTRVHGIAIDRVGNVHLVQAKSVLRPAAGWNDAGADAGGGGPMGGAAAADTTAPVITAFNVPANTTGSAITIGIAATDASGVTQVRVRDNGAQGGWQPFAGAVPHTLVGYGVHVLEVEVRDPHGNVSAVASGTVTYAAPPVDPQPDPQPDDPTPANPTPGNPAPNDPAVVGGGGEAKDDLPKPKITSARMPIQSYRSRRIRVRVRALKTSADAPVTLVRFSTTGRWSKWQRLRSRNFVYLPRGTGWKGVLVQVRDTAGARSTPWFQPVLLGKRGTRWLKGTSKANRIRGSHRSEHIESTQFDRKRDIISCGGGWDTVYAQPEDFVSKSCERVIRVKMPRW